MLMYISCIKGTVVRYQGKAMTDNRNKKTRMWANAQRDGRPAEYRWRSLLNAAKG